MNTNVGNLGLVTGLVLVVACSSAQVSKVPAASRAETRRGLPDSIPHRMAQLAQDSLELEGELLSWLEGECLRFEAADGRVFELVGDSAARVLQSLESGSRAVRVRLRRVPADEPLYSLCTASPAALLVEIHYLDSP